MLENVNKLGCKISMHKKMGCGLYEELLELLVKVQGCGMQEPMGSWLWITCRIVGTLYM